MFRKFDNSNSNGINLENQKENGSRSYSARGCLAEFCLFLIFAAVIIGIFLALVWSAGFLYSIFMSTLYT